MSVCKFVLAVCALMWICGVVGLRDPQVPPQLRIVHALESINAVKVESNNFTYDQVLYNGNITSYISVPEGKITLNVTNADTNEYLIPDNAVQVWNNTIYTFAIFDDPKSTYQLLQFVDSFRDNGKFSKDDSVIRFINMSPSAGLCHINNGDKTLFESQGYTVDSGYQTYQASSITELKGYKADGTSLSSESTFGDFEVQSAYTIWVFSKKDTPSSIPFDYFTVSRDRDYFGNTATGLSASIVLTLSVILALFSN